MSRPTLEVTTMIGCPLMCNFCPQDNLRDAYGRDDPKYMSLETFKTAVDKLPWDTRIDFSGMAEAWVNPDCTRMLAYALERGHDVAIYTTLYNWNQTTVDEVSELLIEFKDQIEVFSKNIKTLLQAVKENVKEISKKRKELRELIREQSKNLKEISKLKRINTSFAKKKIAELSLKNVKLLQLRNEILRFIQDKKEIITEFIKPKIEALKTQLRDIITKLAIPSLQASKLKLLKSIPGLIKTIIKEVKEK